MIDDLLDRLYAARLVQATAKERLLAAKREYDEVKAKAYLEAVESGDAHYKALYSSALVHSVRMARLEQDTAEISQCRAWIESNNLANRLSVHQGIYQAHDDALELDRL